MMWIIYLTLKDDEGKIKEIPIGSQETQLEADAFMRGWANAIVTHTEEAELSKILGMFRITRIGEEEINEKGLVNS